jgi:hypothetical protein
MSGAELYQSASLADSSSKFLSLVSHLVIRTSGDSPSVGIQASAHEAPPAERIRRDTSRGYGGAVVPAGENQWRWPHRFFSAHSLVRRPAAVRQTFNWLKLLSMDPWRPSVSRKT